MILIYKNVIVRSEETPNYITEQFVFVISTPTLRESVHDRLLSSHTQKWEFLVSSQITLTFMIEK